MLGLLDPIKKLLYRLRSDIDPLEASVRTANAMLSQLATTGVLVSDEISQPILRTTAAVHAGNVTPAIEQAFYRAYTRLSKLMSGREQDGNGGLETPFKDALRDSDLLLKFASETGIDTNGPDH